MQMQPQSVARVVAGLCYSFMPSTLLAVVQPPPSGTRALALTRVKSTYPSLKLDFVSSVSMACTKCSGFGEWRVYPWVPDHTVQRGGFAWVVCMPHALQWPAVEESQPTEAERKTAGPPSQGDGLKACQAASSQARQLVSVAE